MSNSVVASDPCVETGTRLCNELEECLTELVVGSSSTFPHRTGASSSVPSLLNQLQRLIEDLYHMLHYHVIALTGKSQCLQVEGVLYRHLQLVSCRVISSYLKERRSADLERQSRMSGVLNEPVTVAPNGYDSDDDSAVRLREALLFDGDLLTVDGRALPEVLPKPSPFCSSPPTAVLTSWLSSLLPDADNGRCYAAPTGPAIPTPHLPSAAVVVAANASSSLPPLTSVKATATQPLPHPAAPTAQHHQLASLSAQLRRLLFESLAGTSLSSTLTAAHPSSAFYPNASATGTNAVTEAARKFALNTLRPIALSSGSGGVAAAGQTSAAAPTTAAAITGGVVSAGLAAAGSGVSSLSTPRHHVNALGTGAPLHHQQQPPQAVVRGRGTPQTLGIMHQHGAVAAGGGVGSSAMVINNSIITPSVIPDNVYLYTPRMALPLFYSHLLPAAAAVGGSCGNVALCCGGEEGPTAGSPPSSIQRVVTPSAMLVPSFYNDYHKRVCDISSEGTQTEHTQQIMFELSKDQLLERANQNNNKNANMAGVNVTSIAAKQRHWRRADPFSAVLDAQTRYEDDCFAAEEDADTEAAEHEAASAESNAAQAIHAHDDSNNPHASPAASRNVSLLLRRLAVKRSRSVENTFGLLVTSGWLNNTLDEMISTADFAFFDGSSTPSSVERFGEMVDAFVAERSCAAALLEGNRTNNATDRTCSLKRSFSLCNTINPAAAFSSFITSCERAKVACPIAACRDTEKVVRFSRAMLFTPAVVRPAPIAHYHNNTNNVGPSDNRLPAASADRLWALNRLYFSRRAPNEGNDEHPDNSIIMKTYDAPAHPVEPRAVMPIIFRPVDAQHDMFSDLRASERSGVATRSLHGVEEGQQRPHTQTATDSNDDATADTTTFIAPQSRFSLTERVAVEYGVQRRIADRLSSVL